jgi:hypothetical protein
MAHLRAALEDKGGWFWEELMAEEAQIIVDRGEDMRKLEHQMAKLAGDEEDKAALKKLVRDVWSSCSVQASVHKELVEKMYLDVGSAIGEAEVWKGKHDALQVELASVSGKQGGRATLQKQISVLEASHRDELNALKETHNNAFMYLETNLRNDLKDCQDDFDKALSTLNTLKDTRDNELKKLEAAHRDELRSLETMKRKEIDDLRDEQALNASSLSQHKKTIDILHKQVEALESEKTTLEDEKTTLQNEKAVLESEKVEAANYLSQYQHVQKEKFEHSQSCVFTLQDHVAVQSAEIAEALNREEHYKNKITLLERNPKVASCLEKLSSLDHALAACEEVIRTSDQAKERGDAQRYIWTLQSQIKELKKEVFDSREIDYKGKYDLVAAQSAEFAKREYNYMSFGRKAAKEIADLKAALKDTRNRLHAYQVQNSAVSEIDTAHHNTTELAAKLQNIEASTGSAILSAAVDEAITGSLSTGMTSNREPCEADVVKGFLKQIAAKYGVANIASDEVDVEVPLVPAVGTSEPRFDPDPYGPVVLKAHRTKHLAQGRMTDEKGTVDNPQSANMGEGTSKKTLHGSVKRSGSPSKGGDSKRPKGSDEPVKLSTQQMKVLIQMNICVPHHLGNCSMMDCTSFHLDKRVVEPLVDALLQ